MSNVLNNIYKVTKSQYDALLSGEEVKGFTYDSNALYMVEDEDKHYVESETGNVSTNAIVLFSDTTGNKIKESLVKISSEGKLETISLAVQSSSIFNGEITANSNANFNNSLTIKDGKILKFNKINIPTSSNGTTYGTGTNGYVLKSNGTTVYWGKDENTTYSDATVDSSGLMSSTDKSNLNVLVNLLKDDDSNTTIDTIKEVLNAFSNFPEETNIVNALSLKLDKSGGEISGNLSVKGNTTFGTQNSNNEHQFYGEVYFNNLINLSSGDVTISANDDNDRILVNSKTVAYLDDIVLKPGTIFGQNGNYSLQLIVDEENNENGIVLRDGNGYSYAYYYQHCMSVESNGYIFEAYPEDGYFGIFNGQNGFYAQPDLIDIYNESGMRISIGVTDEDSQITHNEDNNLIIGNENNGAYVKFVEDISGVNDNWGIDTDGNAKFSGLQLYGDLTVDSSSSLKITKLLAPTSSNGTTYGAGSSGYVLKSNGTSVYWGSDSNNTTYAASGNTSNKIFLIGRTSQSTSGGTTYSHDTVYVGTDGHLYDSDVRVATINDISTGGDYLPTDGSGYMDGDLDLNSYNINGVYQIVFDSYIDINNGSGSSIYLEGSSELEFIQGNLVIDEYYPPYIYTGYDSTHREIYLSGTAYTRSDYVDYSNVDDGIYEVYIYDMVSDTSIGRNYDILMDEPDDAYQLEFMLPSKFGVNYNIRFGSTNCECICFYGGKTISVVSLKTHERDEIDGLCNYASDYFNYSNYVSFFYDGTLSGYVFNIQVDEFGNVVIKRTYDNEM